MRYALLTIRHKWFVFLAGLRIGVPVLLLIRHDLSKFTRKELLHYNRWFFVDKDDPNGFAVAWLHHQNANPHHWEYWMSRTGHTSANQDRVPHVLAMPKKYLLEMVADWMGASMLYTGSWDMSKWLSENLKNFTLHPLTKIDVIDTLGRLGYEYDHLLSIFVYNP